MNLRRLHAFLSIALIFLPCCSVLDEAFKYRRSDELADYLNPRIGTMNYDDAITAFGPPALETEGKEVLSASWKRTSGIGESFLTNELILVFDKERRVLKTWQNIRY